jgi:uncharacterized metal-binding protein
MKPKIPIVPCSGIGKSYGSVAREAAYRVTENLCPEKTRLLPLALLVLGGEETRSELREVKAITIDGCKHACAAKVVAESGGTVAHAVDVPEVFRRHRTLKPSGIADLDENGQKLAQVLAEEIKNLIDSPVEGVRHA